MKAIVYLYSSQYNTVYYATVTHSIPDIFCISYITLVNVNIRPFRQEQYKLKRMLLFPCVKDQAIAQSQ